MPTTHPAPPPTRRTIAIWSNDPGFLTSPPRIGEATHRAWSTRLGSWLRRVLKPRVPRRS